MDYYVVKLCTLTMLSIAVGLTMGAQCSQDVDLTYALSSHVFSYTGIDNLVLANSHICSDNRCLYTLMNGDISGSEHSVISKTDGVYANQWHTTIQGTVYKGAFEYTADENYLIFTPYLTTSCTIVKAQTLDGTFEYQESISGVTRCTSIIVDDSNSVIYVAGKQVSAQIVKLNLADLSYVASYNHASSAILSMYQFTIGANTEMILTNSLDELLGITYQFTSLDMTTGSVEWGKKLGCFLVCGLPQNEVESIIFSDIDMALQLLRDGTKLLFFKINITNGALIGSVLKSNISETSLVAADMSYSGDTTLITIRHSGGMHLLRYDPYGDIFTTSVIDTDTEGYFSKVMNNFLYYGGSYIPENNAYIVKILDSDASTDVHFESASGYSLSNDFSLGLTIPSIPSLLELLLGTSDIGAEGTASPADTVSDVVYANGFVEENIYIQETKVSSIEIGVPCSISGSNPVISSITNHPTTGTFPPWITLNPDGLHLDINPPNYDVNNDYYFEVTSTVLGEQFEKLFKITVYTCESANCDSCSYDSVSTCEVCVTNYELNQSTQLCELISVQIEPDDESEDDEISFETTAAVRTTVIYLATTGSISLFGSIVMGTSLNSLWALINQLQLISMLPFLDSYLTVQFLYFINEFEFARFEFSFLSILPIPGLEEQLAKLDYNQPIDVLAKNDIESGSYIINQLEFILASIIFIIFNAFFLVIYGLLKCCKGGKTCSCLNELFKLFHFTVYIRVALEAFCFNFLICLGECIIVKSIIYHPISYGIAFIMASLSIGFLILLYMISRRTKSPEKTTYFSEVVKDFKTTPLSRYYMSIFIMRRILLVCILLFLRDYDTYNKIAIFGCLQLIVLFYTCYVRPFEDIRDNIIEISNELFYLAVICILVPMHKMATDNVPISLTAIYLVVASGVVSSLIFLVFIVRELFVYFKKKCTKNKKENRVKPDPDELDDKKSGCEENHHQEEQVGISCTRRIIDFKKTVDTYPVTVDHNTSTQVFRQTQNHYIEHEHEISCEFKQQTSAPQDYMVFRYKSK